MGSSTVECCSLAPIRHMLTCNYQIALDAAQHLPVQVVRRVFVDQYEFLLCGTLTLPEPQALTLAQHQSDHSVSNNASTVSHHLSTVCQHQG